MDEYYFISFGSANHAILTENILREEKIDVAIIPTPREVTESCGLSIKIREENLENVKSIIKRQGIIINGIYILKKYNGNREVIKID